MLTTDPPRQTAQAESDIGRPKLVSIVALDGRDDGSVLALAASLARAVDSRIASAIVESARERDIHIPDVDQLHDASPAGVSASVGGQTVVLGNSALFTALGLSIDRLGDWPERLRQHGQHVLFVAIDGLTAGFIGIVE